MAVASQTLWNNITLRRMYITGSVGSSGFLERFTTDYELPIDTNYNETCASIGLMMFGQRMTGDRYFYVNPLEGVSEWYQHKCVCPNQIRKEG